MFRILSRCLMLVVILFGLLIMPGAQTGRAEPLLVTGVTLLSPTACPSGGCAAGQRFNYKVDFGITKTDPNRSPNLQVCMYFPIKWEVTQASASVAGLGSITSTPYTKTTINCNSAPTDYNVVVGATATIQANTATESLKFSFRLGAGASTNGSVIVRVIEKDINGNWSQTGEGSNNLTVVPTTTSVFVANDATACAASTPCYINSGDDLLDGFGTGLKDAIDGVNANATITLLGDYSIKNNAVTVDEAVVLKSKDTSRITYAVDTNTTPVCTEPMLSVTAGASLSGLSVDEGVCRTTTNTTLNHRNLVLVDNPTSTSSVLIESSSLKGGLDGVHVDSSNTGALTMRFNEITGNSGWAIYLASGNTGVLTAYANNLSGNKTGPQVECSTAAKGLFDHNFWGTGVLASAGSSDCTVNDAKRLGAAILDNVASPGVQAKQVTVKTDPIQYAFDNNAVGYQRTGSGSDFGMVIVNHGVSIPDSIPFAAGILGSPTPCSNFWDVFLTDAAVPVSPATLKLVFKYNLTTECAANVESVQYCGQTAESTQFPLYWFNQSAADWKTTGAGGQPTVCLTDANKAIQVTIDNSTTNHPNFNDLARQPFAVALPGQPVLSSLGLVALAGNGQVTIRWVTVDETNVAGFFVQRKTADLTDFQTVGDLISIKGAGATYQLVDPGLVNGTTYYYRLKVTRPDNTFFYTMTKLVTPVPPTPTLTLVPSRSPFPTSTFIFKSPTPTWTFTPTPTSPFKTVTNTPKVTATSLTRTATSTLVATTQLPSTALAQTRAARTEIVKLSATATLTLTATTIPVSQQAEPLTVAMAILAVGTLAGGAFFLLREQRHSS
jgi:hypothetical protein